MSAGRVRRARHTLRVLEVIPVADHWLRHLRFGRDRAELTTKS
ncbi:hypothetical protein [Streptomyces sp. C184]